MKENRNRLVSLVYKIKINSFEKQSPVPPVAINDMNSDINFQNSGKFFINT